MSRVVFDDYDMICMVDTQPEQGNHSLPAAHFPDVVIDHHPVRPETRLAVVADVGGPIGATSTVVVEYLRASKLEVPPAIATALFYGIKADTRDLDGRPRPRTSRPTSGSSRGPTRTLSMIEPPRLLEDYFRLSRTAIDKAEVHGHAVVLRSASSTPRTWSPRWPSGSSTWGMRWSLAFGEYRGDLYYSVRTTDRRINAGKLIREVIEPAAGPPAVTARWPAPGSR